MATIIMLIIIALIAALVIVSIRKATPNSKNVLEATKLDPVTYTELDVNGIQEIGITIPIKLLPATTKFDEKSLYEITDNIVISRISALIPFTSQTGTRVMTTNALKSLKDVELIKMDIPFSQLSKSKDVVGAARGYTHVGKGVAAQANLTKVDVTQVAKATTLANSVANVMNVGSLVVGQYYMSEISSKLETLTHSIDKIGDFQDREFKSRILSALTLVREISQFSSEIMENDDQRKIKLIALENLKATATELLGQVNITISDSTQKNHNPDYKKYQSQIGDFKLLVDYQNVLITVLEKISELTHLLGKGTISFERSYSSFNKYLELSAQSKTLLREWHNRQVNALHIDLDKERISKVGFEAVISAIPGLIDDKFKYKEVGSTE